MGGPFTLACGRMIKALAMINEPHRRATEKLPFGRDSLYPHQEAEPLSCKAELESDNEKDSIRYAPAEKKCGFTGRGAPKRFG